MNSTHKYLMSKYSRKRMYPKFSAAPTN